ncbi:alpha-1,3-mannosyl-glycoprotein 4-beta-N-acetylglucosaminyltransferase B [Drosophila santomea]|uniref:alpha-1,3-mannosyl-glycoprotein 4-beta-N-acetylglucosaminyltransferase B n=1 Tax=Drosophila santomea TaxID=129105 RepID=UPI00195467CE|nr:alpha-1,3-mannosyl-glycoprotein 4-beta-N-acetylglucosaminyltransferase B [Drosophila santomea]
MKVISFRWKTCLSGIVIVAYLVSALLHFGMDITNIEPVEPRVVNNKTKVKIQDQRMFAKSINHNGNWETIVTNPELKPRYRFGGGRSGVKFVIGVPTVLRPKRNYVLQTVDSLILRMTPEQRDNSLIVIFVGETKLQFAKFIVKELQANHSTHMQAGLIDVIAPPLNYYPNFSRLRITLDDDAQRVQWRTKQNLDFMYLMSYAKSRGAYYLQLEDDVMANVGFLDYIHKFAVLHGSFRMAHQIDWIVMSFSDLGFIGKLFRTSVLSSFVAYLKLFYNDQPIDWLLQSFVTLQSCRWDSVSEPECQKDFEARLLRSAQSQFQHMGAQSSLAEKEQYQKDALFNKNIGRQRMQHLRQPVNLIASHRNALLKQELDLQMGETFMWIYMPRMPKMMKYLIANQFKKTQIHIRNARDTAHNLAEFNIELVKESPTLVANSSSTSQCGFVMSHTIQPFADGDEKAEVPLKYMYYYIKEEPEGLTWFRRFLWASSGSSCPELRSTMVLVLLVFLL